MTATVMRWWRVRDLTRRMDRVEIGLVLFFLLLGLIRPEQAWSSLRFTLGSLWDIAPFLMLSLGIAAYLKAAGADRLIAKAFSGRPALVIITASLFGALSPFCSCGVIPVIASLLASGVPLAPVMSFWIASPLMSPEMFLLIAGELGVEFAVAKLIAALGMGLLGGWSTQLLLGAGLLANPLRIEYRPGCRGGGGGSVGGGGDGGNSGADNPEAVAWSFWREPERRGIFTSELGRNLWFLGKWLTLAFALESLMVDYLPPGLIAGWLGGDSLYAVPLAALVGVPAYLNGYAAIPLVAGLITTGMSAGAGLTFMTAGGVTSIPAAVAVFALVRKPLFALYLFLSLTGSILAGLAYQLYLG